MEFKFVKIRQVDLCFTSKGREFKLVTFTEHTIDEQGKESSTGKSGKRTFWPRRENVRVLNVKTQEATTETWKGDIDYCTMRPGEKICGEIIEFKTTSFQLDGKTNDTFYSVIFEGELDRIKQTARQMLYMKLNAAPLDESGAPYFYKPQVIEIENEYDE